MLKVRFNRNWVHKRYKYTEGQELEFNDDDANELEPLGVLTVIGRKGRPPKLKDETFKPFVRKTGRKVKFGATD